MKHSPGNFYFNKLIMESSQNGGSGQIQIEEYRSSEISPNLNKQTTGSFSGMSSQKGLLEGSGQLGSVEDKAQAPKKHKRSFFKYFIKPPRRPGFPKLGSPALLVSPSATFQRIANERDVISRSTPTPAPAKPFRGLKDGVKVPFVGEIRWVFMKEAVKEWLRNPKNLALLIWGIAVAVSGAILFLVLVGFLNRAVPKKSERDAWFEVNNQILNALFTMMCLYLHPQRCYHLLLLIRWKPEDIVNLRKVYCKNETYKPHEWAHMMVVVLLLQINCFAQYALCGLNWGYKRSQRPAIGVGLCVSVAIGAPAAAGLYLILSPLGKDYEAEGDLETTDISITDADADADVTRIDDNSVKNKSTYARLEKKYSLLSRGSKRMEPKPEWQGGLFDCWSDPSVAFFSTFCGFCVFGWNMDRLGFGNMYVHIVTFILLCMAPYWIFTLAAVNIDNENIREGLGITGIILCVFGLLYGGFWRIQMRKRFGLPGNGCCCGQPNVTDLMQWLFCGVCSLCQEVRTGNFYEVCEDKLYSKKYLGQDSQDLRDASPSLAPLGHEPGSPALNSPSWVKSDMSPNLNAQASVSPVLSPMHYSIENSLPPQGMPLVREGSTFPLSNFLSAETHITISPESESADAHNVAAQTENLKRDGYPMNAPIPQSLEK